METGAQPGGTEGRPPLPFLENRKKCPDFLKKALIVSFLGFNLPFKMLFQVYLGVKLQNFALRDLFSRAFDEKFIEVP